MKKLFVSLIVLMFAAAPVSANLVVDGGFETPHFNGQGYEVFTDGETIGAWTVTASEPTGVDLAYDTLNTPPIMFDMLMSEGTQMLHIGESARDNTITQTISGFSVGAKYELSLAVMNWGDDYTFDLPLQLYNADTDSYDLDVIDDMGGPTGPAARDGAIVNTLPYTSHEFFASNAELELIINNPAGTAWTIDDVTITLAGTIVGSTDPTSLDVWENASQGPTSGTFTIVLNADPGVNPDDTITVTIDPNSNGNGEDLTVNGSTAPIDITFNETNWDTPQTITVAAIDDIWADGKIEVDQVGFTIVSADDDPNYATAIIPSVNVTIHDDDSDAVVVSKTGVSLNEEGTTSDTYTVVPATAISGDTNVYIGIPNPIDPNVPEALLEVTVNGSSTAQLTFTTSNWSTPQTVTVTAIDDTVGDGDPHNETIGHTVKSADPIYNDIGVSNVLVTITDNDCGSWGYNPMDFNTDCYINLLDFAEFAAVWLDCTVPYEPGCAQ